MFFVQVVCMHHRVLDALFSIMQSNMRLYEFLYESFMSVVLMSILVVLDVDDIGRLITNRLLNYSRVLTWSCSLSVP